MEVLRGACRQEPSLGLQPQLLELGGDSCSASDPCSCGSEQEADSVLARPENVFRAFGWVFAHGGSLVSGPMPRAAYRLQSLILPSCTAWA